MGRVWIMLAVCSLLTCTVRVCVGAEQESRVQQTLEVNEYFGVSHPTQIIDFDLDTPATSSTVHVLNEAGRPVPFQLIDGGRRLALQTDLSANQSRRWRVLRGAGPHPTPVGGVAVREQVHGIDGWYEVTNGLTGVRVPTPATASSLRWRPPIDLAGYRPAEPRVFLPAPVQGILYRDGNWGGIGPNGVVLLATRLITMQTRFLERGPLKVVVEVSYVVDHQEYRYGATVLSPAGRGYYTCTITVLAGQPSVLFEEDTDLQMTWSMNLYPGLHPTNARYRGHHADKREYGYEPDGQTYRLRHARAGDVDAQIDLRFDKAVSPSYMRSETTIPPMAIWDPWAANTGWYWQLFDRTAGERANIIGIFAGRASRALSPGMSGVWIYSLETLRPLAYPSLATAAGPMHTSIPGRASSGDCSSATRETI